jgi:hypothetical protein
MSTAKSLFFPTGIYK